VVVHVENTEGLARSQFPTSEFGSVMARLGIGLYGCPNRPDTRRSLGLEPVMTLTAQITNIKEVEPGTPISYNRRWIADRRTHVATVGIGYADGYPRSLRGKAEVGVANHRCPVVGTICMDMIMVDLGPEPPVVSVGHDVVLFGRGGPDVSEVANWADTISYEVVCGLGRRIERQFS
jgi:alanine racemase